MNGMVRTMLIIVVIATALLGSAVSGPCSAVPNMAKLVKELPVNSAETASTVKNGIRMQGPFNAGDLTHAILGNIGRGLVELRTTAAFDHFSYVTLPVAKSQGAGQWQPLFGQGQDKDGCLLILLVGLSAVFCAVVAIQMPRISRHRQRT